MEAIRLTLPPGYEVHTSYDATEYIREELNKIYFRTGLNSTDPAGIRLDYYVESEVSVADCYQLGYQHFRGGYFLLSFRAGDATVFIGRITVSLNLVIDKNHCDDGPHFAQA